VNRGLLIREEDCPTVAWKNGGGTTREIAAFPPGAGMDDFLWRISAARVATAGPFSRFAGIDRTIAILEGTLRLDVDGHTPVHLSSDTAPFAFAGDRPTSGTPIGGEVLDLNLMMRRGHGAGMIQPVAAGPVHGAVGTTLLFALVGTELTLDGQSIIMQAHDVFMAPEAPFDASTSQPMLMISIDTSNG
jgi:environmental stress-induced protein Ves